MVKSWCGQVGSIGVLSWNDAGAQTVCGKGCKKLQKFDDRSNIIFYLSVGQTTKNVAKGVKDFAG